MTSWSHKHITYLTWRFDISFLIRSWETDKHTIIWSKNTIFNFSNLGNTTLTTTWNWTGWSCWRQSQGWTVSRLRGGDICSLILSDPSICYLILSFINQSYLLSSYLQTTTTTMTRRRREADPKKLQRMTMLRSQLSKLTKSSQLLIVFWNRTTRWASTESIQIIPIVDSIFFSIL